MQRDIILLELNLQQLVGDRAQELCEQGGGPGLSFPIPSFPPLSLISLMISVDGKRNGRKKWT